MTTRPCGFVLTGKLRDHLAHYKVCPHPFCQQRWQEWQGIKTEAEKPGAIRILNKRADNRYKTEEGTK